MGPPFKNHLPAAAAPSAAPRPRAFTTRQLGQEAEDDALRYLKAHGLALVERNYRTPGRGGGEIDLILSAPDGTLVFAEVRQRSSEAFGGAAASVGRAKQRRIIGAARHYLMRLPTWPPCRFDVVSLGPDGIEWLPGAFDASN